MKQKDRKSFDFLQYAVRSDALEPAVPFLAAERTEGFEVKLVPHKWGRVGWSNMLFNLLWTNPRGHVGRLNDLVFLKGVTPGSESDKRYIYL